MIYTEPDIDDNARVPIGEAAQLLGIHRSTLLNHTDNGYIKCLFHRVNKRRLYQGKDIGSHTRDRKGPEYKKMIIRTKAKKIFRREEPGRSDHKNKNSMKTSKTEKVMFAILIPIGIYFLVMLIIAIAQFVRTL